MKKTLNHFVHTTQKINGKKAISEFLVPDVVDNTQAFIGLSSGLKYNNATIVATSRFWGENDLFKLLKKVKRVGFFGNSKKKIILKRYIDQIIEIRENYSDTVVSLDEDLNLVCIDSFSSFMNKKSPELTRETDEKKEAYQNLAKKCLNEKDYSEAIVIINDLKNYDGHWKYESTFYFLLNQLDGQNIHLFLSFDWKYAITDFYEFIKMVINKNFNQKVELPSPMIHQARTIISTDGFLNSYKTALNQSNFDMSFIDDNSDQYLIVIYKLANTKKVSELISKLEL